MNSVKVQFKSGYQLATSDIQIKTKKVAKAVVVSLSKPAKMPCPSYGLPALEACPVGKKLAEIENSACSICYALKGQYAFSNVIECQLKRLDATKKAEFVPAMVKLIKGLEYFRWHDSGDVYSYEYLLKIIAICEQTPDTKHWLPTREKGLFLRFIREGGKLPENLTVRISSPMIEKPINVKGFNTSTIHKNSIAFKVVHADFICRAPKQDGFCLDCRACWNKDIKNVSYNAH